MPANWRDEAAATLAAENLRFARPQGPALVAGDHRPEVPEALATLGIEPVVWGRRARDGCDASPWPPEGPFGTVCLRLPGSAEELDMLLHAAACRLEEGGALLVYGAGDEGAKSAPKKMAGLFDDVATMATGGRCRLLRGVRRGTGDGCKGRLADWRRGFILEAPGLPPRTWHSYPGLFAHGRPDQGSELLLTRLPEVLEELPRDAAVLDFACGTGVMGAAVLEAAPEARVDLLDIDALALDAARRNVPRARRTVLASGLAATAEEAPYRLILSNPPYHAGKSESLHVVEALASDAPGRLESGGALVMVVQRRLPVESLLRARFRMAEALADAGPYRVWRAVAPTS